MNTTTLDARELIPVDYRLKSTEELEELKRSIMHSINSAEAGLQLWHREYTAIRIELATRVLNEVEASHEQ